MISDESVNLISTTLKSATNVLVIVDPKASLDILTSACAFQLALVQTGYRSVLATPDLKAVESSTFTPIGSDSAVTEIGNRNLQVVFDYTPEQVDKVNYHINEEEQKFYLTIEPQEGVEPLSSEAVQFFHTGAEADAIFLFGVEELDQLDQLYFGYEQLYEDALTIGIHNHTPAVGDSKIDLSDFSCVSEGIFSLIAKLELQITGDVATNLLTGIRVKTEEFSSLTTTADTFDAIAYLIRAGARRQRLNSEGEKSKVSVSKKKPVVSKK